MPVRIRQVLIQITATDVLRGSDIKPWILETVLCIKTRMQALSTYKTVKKILCLVFVFPPETQTDHIGLECIGPHPFQAFQTKLN